MMEARTREDGNGWADVSWLWPLNPVMRWVIDKLVQRVERHTAPVVDAAGLLGDEEAVFIVRGTVPNRRAQLLLVRWYAVRFNGSTQAAADNLGEWIARIKLGTTTLPNTGRLIGIKSLENLRLACVKAVAKKLEQARIEYQGAMDGEILEYDQRLSALRARHERQLELEFEGVAIGEKRSAEKNARAHRIEETINRFWQQVSDTLQTEPGGAHVEIAAVLAGKAW
jgi:hypothetical protein